MRAKALIAEDEPLLAQALQTELAALWPELEVVSIAPNGIVAQRDLLALVPDIAFLDVRMPGASGIEVAQAIAEDWPDASHPPLLVFVTAYDQFALDAFGQAAVDYVLKPVQRERLAHTVQRLKQRLSERASGLAEFAAQRAVDELAAQLQRLLADIATTGNAAGNAAGNATRNAAGNAAGNATRNAAGNAAGNPTRNAAGNAAGNSAGNATQSAGEQTLQRGTYHPERLRALRAGVGDTVRMIRLDEVIYLQATDKYVNVVTAESELLIREPLRDLMPRLDARQFAQVHRSTVVNLDFVVAASRDSAGRLWLTMRGRNERIAVSRIYAHLFKAM